MDETPSAFFLSLPGRRVCLSTARNAQAQALYRRGVALLLGDDVHARDMGAAVELFRWAAPCSSMRLELNSGEGTGAGRADRGGGHHARTVTTVRRRRPDTRKRRPR